MTFKPEVGAIGVTNRTEDNKHIMFLDFDHVHPDVIRKDLDYLIDCGLSNFYILETGPNCFHAISFTKLPFRSMLELASHTHEDKRHYQIPETHNRRSTVLRISGKYDLKTRKQSRTPPAYVSIYPHEVKNMDSDTSTAHFNLYKALFNILALPYLNQDDYTSLEIVGYETLKG